MSQHDSLLLPEGLDDLADIASLIGFDLDGSYLTLDSAFDGERNKACVRRINMIPVVKPNRRGTKDEQKLEQMYEDFNEQVYKERYRIERTFAWADTYRKLVTRYEMLESTHIGFKYLAYSLVNLRVFFGGDSL